METKKVVAVNTISQLVGKFVTAAVTFLISFLIARSYGATGYGDFTKITTYVAIFYLLADFGLNAIYLQKTADNQNPSFFSSLFSLRFLMGLILIFLAFAILVFLPGNSLQGYSQSVKFSIILFLPTILFQAIITTTNALFQKKLRYDLSAVSSIAGSIITLITVFLVINLFLPTVGVAGSILALTIGSLVTTLISIILTKPFFKQTVFQLQKNEIKTLLSSALPLGVTLIFNVLYFRADSFILALSRTTQEVGVYGLAYKVFEFPLVFPTFFMNALFPILLINQLTNVYLFQKQIKKAALCLSLASVGILIIGWILAPFLTLIKFDFAPSIMLLRILLLGLPIFFLSSLTMWVLIALKKQTSLLIIYSTSMFINIIANILLIPHFGAVAAAWTTVGSECIVLLLSWITIQHTSRDNVIARPF